MYRLFVFALLIGATWTIVLPVQALEINYAKSSVVAEKGEVQADGIDSTLITVKIVDGFGVGYSGIDVALTSSRGGQDELLVVSGKTNLFGKASFRVKSLWKGTSTYTASIGDQRIEDTASVTFTGGLAIDLETGDLIKIPDDGDPLTQSDTAVYYYSSNGKRYVFPNEKTYFTWYTDFRNVKTIPIDQMSMVPIGGNATYRPGVKLVKFQTDVKTYAVARGGVLRWLKTEEVAQKFYGTDWMNNVDDISEGFYVNYEFGNPIEISEFYVREFESDRSRTIDQDKSIANPSS